MNIKQMTLEDFFEIKQNLSILCGDRHKEIEYLHHPMLYYEFGKTAYVIRSKDKIIAYLFGILPQTSETAYVHLVAVDPSHRKNGYGSSLYRHFIDFAKSIGFKKVKAIASPQNAISISFHRKIGMKLLGKENQDGVLVVNNYSSQGDELVVFEKKI